MISRAEADKLFAYQDGELIWKVSLSNRAPKGSKVSGVNPAGYKRLRVRGDLYMAHKIVWLLHHGYIPGMVDHIDGDPGNNRIENLRLCGKTTNGYNAKISKRNTSGVKGVSWNKMNKNWRAGIQVDGKRVEVGSFPSKSEAISAISKARYKYHGEFARAY